MRINSIHIENFRGIRGTYELGVNGESRVIVGPNGSGKSSILGAIDFLLSGGVTHLTGEGMGGAQQANVLSNVGSDGQCVVRCEFVDSNGELYELERDGASGELTPPVEELPTGLQRLFNTAQQGQHILTRDDILDLIIAQPHRRREVLRTMLDLPEIDDQRLTLQRTRSDLETEVEKAKSSAEAALDRVRELAESDANAPLDVADDVLTTINGLRTKFEGEPTDSIEPKTVRDGIESPAETVAVDALQREQPLQALRDLEEWVNDFDQEFEENVEELGQLLEKSERDNDLVVDTRRLELLELGEKVVPTNAEFCPLCEQEWNEPPPLHEDIRRRRKELNNLRQLREKVDKKRKKTREYLHYGLELLEYLSRELDSERYPAGETFADFREMINATVEQLSEIDINMSPQELESLPLLEGTSVHGVDFPASRLRDVLEELQVAADEVPMITKQEQAYERLNSLAVEWTEYEKVAQRVEEIRRLHNEIETAEQDFIKAQKRVIGDIYAEIADTVEDYYSRIHPDEAGGNTSIDVTRTGAELQQQFYTAGEYPPQLVQSEGHLDTLGLCLYLALSKYLQQDAESLLLLDDIVMSVDKSHRREVAKLLAEEVADQYQLFIATHDELWAEQLRSHGALHGGSSVNLREWSLESGIAESRRRIDVNQQWETVVDAMESDEMERAAHEMRYAVEQMLQQTCMVLGAKVEYKPQHNYTVSDFKDAVSGRLGELTGDAKNKLHGYEHHENSEELEQMYKQAEKLKGEYGSVLDDIGQALQKVNRRVHWSPGKWLTLGPAEFEEVFEAHRRAYNLLYCADCGSSIRYQKFGGGGEKNIKELRCNCCEHYYIRW